MQTCQDAEIFKGEIFTFANFRKTKKKLSSRFSKTPIFAFLCNLCNLKNKIAVSTRNWENEVSN